jgi:hypothetical protein
MKRSDTYDLGPMVEWRTGVRESRKRMSHSACMPSGHLTRKRITFGVQITTGIIASAYLVERR